MFAYESNPDEYAEKCLPTCAACSADAPAAVEAYDARTHTYRLLCPSCADPRRAEPVYCWNCGIDALPGAPLLCVGGAYPEGALMLCSQCVDEARRHVDGPQGWYFDAKAPEPVAYDHDHRPL